MRVDLPSDKRKWPQVCQGRFRPEIGKNFSMEQDAQGSG